MAFNLAGLGGKVAKWSSGVGWQLLLFKILAAGAILTIVATWSYREGKADCTLAVAEKAIQQVTEQQVVERQFVREQLQIQRVEIQNRLKVTQAQSQEAQQLRYELVQIRGRLDEAINARPANPACAPSSDELREYREIAERTRPSR